MPCDHKGRRRAYVRGPRPNQAFVTDGWLCPQCGRVDDHGNPQVGISPVASKPVQVPKEAGA